MSKIVLFQGDDVKMFDDNTALFKELYDKDIFIETVKDGVLNCKDTKDDKEVVFNFGILDADGTKKAFESDVVTYRDKLRTSMEELKGLVEFTADQTDKLANGFKAFK